MFRSQPHGQPLDTDPVTAPALAPVITHVSWMNCPRCGLSIQMRAGRPSIRYCPRCIARRRLLVEVFASPQPAETLYERHQTPSAPEQP